MNEQTENKKVGILKGLKRDINWPIFIPAAIVLVALETWGVIDGQSFAEAANSGLAWVEKYFSWFLCPLAFFTVIFCLWAAFSKYGKIKLGGENAKPIMSMPVWFAIALTSGIATGINFYGVLEPIDLFYNPPAFLENILPLSEGAAQYAMRYSFLHWCLHPYAIYTAAGLCMVFMYFNTNRRYRVSDSLYPILGEKVNGRVGDLIDSFAIMVLIGGIATSLGISVLQTSKGMEYLFGFASNPINWFIIITGMSIVYLTACVTGLKKGITYVSNTNTILYFVVLIFGFLVIDPFGIMDLFITSIADYISTFISTSLYAEPIARTSWVQQNNVFYFTWFFVFAPMVGLFLIKLAYGRTIREFVFVNLIAPSIFVAVWFTVFGGGAIFLDKFKGTNIYEMIVEGGAEVSWYALFEQLPFSTLFNCIALIIVMLSFITLGESLTLSLSSMTCTNYNDRTGEAKPPRALSIFWGIVMGGSAYILMINGGIQALQTSVVVFGLPAAILMCFMIVAFVKSMLNHKEYDLSDNPTEIDK